MDTLAGFIFLAVIGVGLAIIFLLTLGIYEEIVWMKSCCPEFRIWERSVREWFVSTRVWIEDEFHNLRQETHLPLFHARRHANSLR